MCQKLMAGDEMGLRVLVVGVLAVLPFVASCGTDTTTETALSEDSPSTTPTESPEEDGRCDYPSKRPTYLPWSKGKTDEPEEETFNGNAQLSWTPDDSKKRWEDSYVVFWQSHSGRIGATRSIGVKYQGVEGMVSIGEGAKDDDVADVAVVWQRREGDCNTTTLALFSPALTLDEGREEIVRIARSLEERS